VGPSRPPVTTSCGYGTWVVRDCEHGSGDGDDGFLSIPGGTAEAKVLRTQIAVLLPARCPGCLCHQSLDPGSSLQGASGEHLAGALVVPCAHVSPRDQVAVSWKLAHVDPSLPEHRRNADLAHELLPRTRELAQGVDVGRGNETASDQTVSVQVNQPVGVLPVALAARQILDLSRVGNARKTGKRARGSRCRILREFADILRPGVQPSAPIHRRTTQWCSTDPRPYSFTSSQAPLLARPLCQCRPPFSPSFIPTGGRERAHGLLVPRTSCFK
jgi:hypothetical protein